MINVEAKITNNIDANAWLKCSRVIHAQMCRYDGITDYDELKNHPLINDVELVGNKTSSDLKILKHDTTANWNKTRYIPAAGEIIVYDDYTTKKAIIDGEETTIYIPAIKIGTGNGYVQDLQFVGDDMRDLLLGHINNATVHITENERLFWNNKLNVDETQADSSETLSLNRN